MPVSHKQSTVLSRLPTSHIADAAFLRQGKETEKTMPFDDVCQCSCNAEECLPYAELTQGHYFLH